jgi:hypothetical protein
MTVREAIGILDDIFNVYSGVNDSETWKKVKRNLAKHYKFFIFGEHFGNIYEQNWDNLTKIYSKLKYTREVFVYDIPEFEFVGI